jgi:hypothetical protein
VEKIVSSYLNTKFFGLDKVERSITMDFLNQLVNIVFFFFADHIEVLIKHLIHWLLDENKQKYIEENISTPKVFYQNFDYEVLKDHNYFPIQTVLFKKELFIQRGGSFRRLELVVISKNYISLQSSIG